MSREGIPLDLKLVSVKLDAFALALPTFSLGFWKSFFFSFFFLVLEPILTRPLGMSTTRWKKSSSQTAISFRTTDVLVERDIR